MQSLILLLITFLAHVTSQQCPGMYPHPSDCDKFYQCDSSRSYLFNCPEGTLFDKTLGLCNHKYLVTCSSSISSIPPSPPTTTISVTYPWRPQTTVRPSTSVTRPSWISSTSTMSTSTKQTDMDDAPSNLIPDSEDNSGSNSEAASESGSNSGSNLPSSSNDNNPSGVSLPSESGSQSQQGSGSVTNLPSDSENLSSDGQPSGGNRPSENNPDSGSNYQPGSESGSNLSSSSSENISDDNKPSDSNLPSNPDSDYNPDSESNKNPEIELNLPSDNEPVTRPPTDSELSNSEGSVSETSDAELSNSETPDSELSNSEVSESEPEYSVSASSLYPCSQPGYYSEETSCDQFYVCKEVAPGVLSADRIFRLVWREILPQSSLNIFDFPFQLPKQIFV